MVGESRNRRYLYIKHGLQMHDLEHPKCVPKQKKVSARLEKQREKVASADYNNTSKRLLSKLRNDYTFTLKELESINRRIDICESELNLK